MTDRIPPSAAAVWGRLGAVAGGVRTLAAELAAEVIETAEDLAMEAREETGARGGGQATKTLRATPLLNPPPPRPLPTGHGRGARGQGWLHGT